MSLPTEDEVREKLKKMGYLNIRKRYGQRYKPMISADHPEKGRIWVKLTEDFYQTRSNLCFYDSGKFSELKS